MKKLATIFIALLVAVITTFGGLIGCNREESMAVGWKLVEI